MTVLLAFLGLAIDSGYLQLLKTRMQTAADAAALGGAQQIRMTGPADAPAAARADAALNGFTDGIHGVTVAVSTPPATGYYTTDASGVEVTIAQSVNPFFMELVGSGPATVRARAVARLASSPSCVYTLDPAAPGSFSASGGATVQLSCGIQVNSTSGTAMTVSGGAVVSAANVTVAGNYSVSGGGVISPAPATGVAAAGDPLGYIAAPAVGSCSQTGLSISGGTRTLDQGVYCGGISVSGGAYVTFNPGTYVLEGGGLQVSGGASITGTGITFYNTAGAGYTYGAIGFSGGTTVDLAAPATGPLAGILFFEDRGIVGGAASTFSGGTAMKLQGALYFPTTALTYSGGSSGDPPYTLIVAKTVTFTGGTVVNDDYSSLPAGSPAKGGAALSE